MAERSKLLISTQLENFAGKLASSRVGKIPARNIVQVPAAGIRIFRLRHNMQEIPPLASLDLVCKLTSIYHDCSFVDHTVNIRPYIPQTKWL